MVLDRNTAGPVHMWVGGGRQGSCLFCLCSITLLSSSLCGSQHPLQCAIPRTWRLQVCWRSGKVQLNSGIIERRYQNWEKAEAHFRLARVGC